MPATEVTPGDRIRTVLLNAPALGDIADAVVRITAPTDPLPDDVPIPDGRMTAARRAGLAEARRIHGAMRTLEATAHALRAQAAADELAAAIERDPAAAAAGLRRLSEALGGVAP